jgi:hypothetical protein
MSNPTRLLTVDEQERLYWEKHPRGSDTPKNEAVAEAIFICIRTKIPDCYYDPDADNFGFTPNA